MIHFKILGTPMAKQSFRFSVRGKGDKQFVQKYQPKAVVDNERNLKYDIRSQLKPDFKPFDCALDVSILLVFPPLKSWSKKEMAQFKTEGVIIYHDKKPDADNSSKQILDSMQDIVFLNDSRISRLSITKIYGEVPRTEITVCPINDSTKPWFDSLLKPKSINCIE